MTYLGYAVTDVQAPSVGVVAARCYGGSIRTALAYNLLAEY